MTVLETYPDGTQLVEFETQIGEKQRFIKHEDGSLRLYNRKPYKIDDFWAYLPHYTSFDCFAHLFQSVQWEDDEPCEFREYI